MFEQIYIERWAFDITLGLFSSKIFVCWFWAVQDMSAGIVLVIKGIKSIWGPSSNKKQSQWELQEPSATIINTIDKCHWNCVRIWMIIEKWREFGPRGLDIECIPFTIMPYRFCKTEKWRIPFSIWLPHSCLPFNFLPIFWCQTASISNRNFYQLLWDHPVTIHFLPDDVHYPHHKLVIYESYDFFPVLNRNSLKCPFSFPVFRICYPHLYTHI